MALDISLETLAHEIDAQTPEDGMHLIHPGLYFYKRTTPGDPMHNVVEPSLCVIAGGVKNVQLGEEGYRYDPGRYLITTMPLPLVGTVVKAAPDQPYLGMQMTLDTQMVTTLIMEAGGSLPRNDQAIKALDVSYLDDNLLDATLRLVRLAAAPTDYAVLADAVKREITYRLLKGAQGPRLHHLARLGGEPHRMAKAIAYLQQNFSKAIRIKDLAHELGMSASTFHASFKTATAMSPIQFQKQLRLQEARRLMQSEGLNAAEAGFEVGYEDASHFSREYKREFGKPPKQDSAQLRTG